MVRVALVIGTGEYGESFKSLSAAPKDAEAVAEILRNPEMGGFDQVETLLNPLHTEMAEKIETWFREQQKDDLALLYISGHGVKDTQRELYFAARNSRKQKEELVRSTAVSASFVRDCIRNSKAKRQTIILDCCFSGAFGDLLAKDDDKVDLETLLGAEGRVVLASSSSVEYSLEQKSGGLSIYTHYLVEGIRTGAADLDGDGAISIRELHHYVGRKVQEESPLMNPKIIVLKDEGYQIRIAKAPLGDPKIRYRKELDAIAEENEGEISFINRTVLEEFQQQLNLTLEEAAQIESEVLEPYRQRKAKISKYRRIFTQAVKETYPVNEKVKSELRRLQIVLGFRDTDADKIESAVLEEVEPKEKVEYVLPEFRSLLESRIDFINSAIRSAEKKFDLSRAAELKYGRSNNLERKLRELTAEGMLLQMKSLLEDEIRFTNQELEEAEQEYDLNRAAELKYGCLPDLQNRLQQLEARLINQKISIDSNQPPVDNPVRSKTIEPEQTKPKSKKNPEQVKPKSEKNIDYTRLEGLLKTGTWQEADMETYQILVQIIGKKNDEPFTSDEVLKLSCLDLQTIDRLWVKYSAGKFGFSVQRKIYLGCGGKPLKITENDSDIWEKFCDRIKWRFRKRLVEYSKLTFDITAPEGHLPHGVFLWGLHLRGSTYIWIDMGAAFFSRLTNCKL